VRGISLDIVETPLQAEISVDEDGLWIAPEEDLWPESKDPVLALAVAVRWVSKRI
jgi:hypothetical protein